MEKRYMPRVYLILGKAGDLISILPCLRADYKETNEKPHLIVSRKYANIVEGLDYLEPIIYPGDWQDVAGALREAKHRYRNVIIPQMHAKDYVPRRQFPSFQLDQWHRCGRLKDWGKLPLIYPKSEGKIESRYILLGDFSESAKFAHIEDLHSALVTEFPNHRIVRLSSVSLPQLKDLVALYDGSDLLITVDTMHVHLSLASSKPVIVLSRDNPSRWHGATFHPRMAMHVRYGDYEMKKAQLLHVARQCVNKSPMPWVVKEETDNQYGYNLSLLKVGNNYWKTYRYHLGKSWRTELFLMRDGIEVPIEVPSKYKEHSIEDGRLFAFKGKPHISVTVARSGVKGSFDPCIQAYGRLDREGKIHDWVEPNIGKNDFSGVEKNWVCFEYQGTLHIIYSHTPSHVVYQMDEKGHAVKEYKTPTPTCSFGEPRGGTPPLSYKGQWLRFFHTNQVNKKSDSFWNYHIGALTMEPHPPFRITKISSQPILSGNELFSEAPHWKPKCSLPYGAVKNGDGFMVGIGLNDCEAGILNVNEEHLNL